MESMNLNESEILTEDRNMNSVVQILINRDGNTEQEAINRFEETKLMMEECAFEPIETEKILMEQLGLEMDYIHDFIEPIPAILWQ